MQESSLALDQKSKQYPLRTPGVTGKSRDVIAQELIMAAESGTMSAREEPMLRAQLCRFDDSDSILLVTVHHPVADTWSVQVIIRDLGAFYAARSSGIPAKLPEVRQYRECSEWQKANVTGETGLAIRAFTVGREELRFQDTQFIISNAQSPFDDAAVPTADGAREIRERLLEESEPPDIPSGMVWNLDVMPSGELLGGMLFNLDEFDESTVEELVAGLQRTLTSAVREPDRDWRTL
jgi:condensation domain-containing protein